MGRLLLQVGESLDLARLASELETVKLLGVVLVLVTFALIVMVFIGGRNMRSQDKQNETTVSSSFVIIGKLVTAIDDLNNTVRDLSVSHSKTVLVLQNIQSAQTRVLDKLDSVLAMVLEANELQDLEQSNVGIPHITDEMESGNE